MYGSRSSHRQQDLKKINKKNSSVLRSVVVGSNEQACLLSITLRKERKQAVEDLSAQRERAVQGVASMSA